MRSRNRQIKELKKQSMIAPRNDYDLVEGNEKSHLRNQKNKAVHLDCLVLLLCKAKLCSPLGWLEFFFLLAPF